METHSERASRTPIIQYWHAAEAPDYIADLLAGFDDLNPELPHLVFDETQAADFIAARFGERELAAFRACAVPAMQADYLRYCAVFALGGVYSDADYRCLRPLGPLVAAGGPQLFRRPDAEAISNGFFAFPDPGHPLLRLALDVATTNIEQRVAETVNMVTGPAVFTGLRLLYEAGSMEGLYRHVADSQWERFATGTWEPLLEPFAAAVGSYERVADAFVDVDVSDFDAAMTWVGPPDSPLPYKRTDLHWVAWSRSRRTIFR